jgi:hypothetical protein
MRSIWKIDHKASSHPRLTRRSGLDRWSLAGTAKSKGIGTEVAEGTWANALELSPIGKEERPILVR